MADLAPQLGDRSMSHIVIPGTHDSGAYTFTREVYDGDAETVQKVLDGFAVALAIPLPVGPLLEAVIDTVAPIVLNGVIAGWGKAQSMSILDQLRGGIRFLDLRVIQYERQLYVYHGFLGVTVDVVLRDIQTFLSESQGEVVILAFGGFKNMLNPKAIDPQQRYRDLSELIRSYLGQYLHPDPATFRGQTLNAIVRSGRRAVVLFDDNGEFSRKTDYQWIGPGAGDLYTDLERTMTPDVDALEAAAMEGMTLRD